MKKRTLLKMSLFALIILISCKKTNDADSSGNNGTTPVTGSLSFDKTSYTPGDIVVITSSKSITGIQTTVSVGGKQVQAAVSGNNIVKFMLPVLSPGSHNSEITIAGSKLAADLTVGNYQKITAYTDTVEKVTQAFTASINYLKGLKESDTANSMAFTYGDLLILDKVQAEYQKQLLNMDASQKEMLAYVCAKYKVYEILNERISWGDSKFNAKLNGTLSDVSDEIFQHGKNFVRNMISLAALIGGTTGALLVPEPTSKIICAVLAGAGLYLLYDANQQVEIMLDKACKAVLADFVSSQRIQSFTVKHIKNKSSVLNLDAKFETITNADLNSSSPWMKNLATEANKVKSYVDEINKVLSTMKSWFSWSDAPQVSPFKNHLPTTPRSKVLSCNASYLRIENISNNAIKLMPELTSEGLKVTCISELMEDVDFTYDLVYEHPEIKLPLRVSIDAEYYGKPNKLTGLWKATELDRYGSNLFVGYSYSFKPLLAGCTSYTGHIQYNDFTLTFYQDGKFDNYQGFVNSYQDYTPNGGVVCSDKRMKNFSPATYPGTYNIENFNTYGQTNIAIRTVNESVAGGLSEPSFTLKLLDDTTMELKYTYSGYTTRYVLKKQP